VLPQRGHRTPSPFADGGGTSVGGFGGCGFAMANTFSDN